MVLPARRGRPPKAPRSFFPTQELPEYIAVPEAARRLSVQPRTLLDMVRRGELPGYKPFHNKVLVPVRAIVELMERSRMPSMKEEPQA